MKRDSQSIVKYVFPGNSKNKIPFQIKIELPESLKSRVIVKRDSKGKTVNSTVPSVR